MKVIKSVQEAYKNAALYKEFKILDSYKEKRSWKIKLKCLRCGFEFDRETRHFNESPHMCPKCHPKMFNMTITLEEAQKRINDVYGENVLTILEYKGNNTITDIKCEKCSYVFQSVPVSLWGGRVRGCPICEKTKSLGEQSVEKYLKREKLEYKSQYCFLECKDKKPLPFDFYIPQFKVCIEFQGEQHYKERSFLWSESLIRHDDIKRKFCKEKDILLIEIPYYDINNLDKYLGFLKNN